MQHRHHDSALAQHSGMGLAINSSICSSSAFVVAVSTTSISIRVPSFDSAHNALGTSVNQAGRFSFFKSVANRGSTRKFFSRGSTFVPISPSSR